MTALTTGLACLTPVNGLCLCAALTSGVRYGASAQTAMRSAYSFSFHGWGAALLLGAFGLCLALIAADSPAECEERVHGVMFIKLRFDIQ